MYTTMNQSKFTPKYLPFVFLFLAALFVVATTAATHSPFPFCLWITGLCYDRCCYQDEVFIPCKDCCSYVFNKNNNDAYLVPAAYCCHQGYWPNSLQCPEIMNDVKDSTDPIIQSWFIADAVSSNSSSDDSSSSSSSSGTDTVGTRISYNFYNVFIDNVVSNTASEVATAAASAAAAATSES